MPRHTVRALTATALVLSLGSTACGGTTKTPAAPKVQTVSQCRSQWHDVAKSVAGLDQATDPSALASRWTSVLATVQYYENTASAQHCQADIEAQLKAITALRDFSTRVQPYDMAFQFDQVAADIGRYLADPLPPTVRPKHGKPVPPPSKAAVTAALQLLQDNAPLANTDLQPGWGELASVELTNAQAVTSAIQDLGFLAQDSTNWRQCNAALQVLVLAIKAHQGASAQSSPTPSATPTS